MWRNSQEHELQSQNITAEKSTYFGMMK
jgi:hypothetical protein